MAFKPSGGRGNPYGSRASCRLRKTAKDTSNRRSERFAEAPPEDKGRASALCSRARLQTARTWRTLARRPSPLKLVQLKGDNLAPQNTPYVNLATGSGGRGARSCQNRRAGLAPQSRRTAAPNPTNSSASRSRAAV